MSKRDPFFDNLKFILIILVVLGHFAFEYRDAKIMRALMNVIYSFHMPLFILISGYFSKSIKQQRIDDVRQILIPYFVLEVIHLLFTKATNLGCGNSSFLYPSFQNWYLLSLFFWRLVIPYFAFVSPLKGIVIAFVFSAASGLVPQLGELMSMYHSLYFLPLFVIGYYIKDIPSIINTYRPYKVIGILMLLSFLTIVFYLSYTDYNKSLEISNALIPVNGYEGQWSTAILRNISLLSGIAISSLFVLLIPQRVTIYSNKGENTMYVYILHMFLIWIIVKYLGVYKDYITLSIAIVSSLLISYVCSLNIVKKFLQPIIELNFQSLIKKNL